jgi:hypothetical protein
MDGGDPFLGQQREHERLIRVDLRPALAGLAQEAKKDASNAPKQNTLSIYRVWVKDGHGTAFKAAVAAHAQKFHTGNWKWRVAQMLSGPDGGAYQIIEGPNSWTDLDGRGDLGAAHEKDYEENIAPHLEKSSPERYLVYLSSCSTTPVKTWSNKTAINHIVVKPGRGSAILALLKLNKPVWEKLGWNVVVYSTQFSGSPEYIISYRLKNGFKDFDEQGPTFRQGFDEVHGPGAYDRGLEEMARSVEHSYGEMMEFKPELSSK